MTKITGFHIDANHAPQGCTVGICRGCHTCMVYSAAIFLKNNWQEVPLKQQHVANSVEVLNINEWKSTESNITME